MNKIIVYGPGCAKCTALAKATNEVLADMKLDLTVEKVSDPMKFAEAGVLMTPALEIDGKLILSGKVPSKEELRRILDAQQAPEAPAKSPESSGCCCGADRDKAGRGEACTCGADKEEKSGCGCRTDKGEKSGSCCCSGGDKHEEGSSCGCGCGCSEGSTGTRLKKFVLWIVVILLLLAGIKLYNRSNKSEPANTAPVPTQTSAKVLPAAVEAVFYEYGAKCATCVRMEKWLDEAVKANFADELKSGLLTLKMVPATEQDVAMYNLTSKALIIKQMRQGKEIKGVDADKLWDVNDDEKSYKDYVTAQIRTALDALKADRK